MREKELLDLAIKLKYEDRAALSEEIEKLEERRRAIGRKVPTWTMDVDEYGLHGVNSPAPHFGPNNRRRVRVIEQPKHSDIVKALLSDEKISINGTAIADALALGLTDKLARRGYCREKVGEA
jgi:hypothetical protein